MKDLVVSLGPFPEHELAALQAEFDVRAAAEPADLATLDEGVRAQARAVAIAGQRAFGAAEMALFPALGLIAQYGVGYDPIDVGAATERGVVVTNTPDVLTDDVADLAVAMAFALARQIVQGDAWVRSGAWAARGAMPLNTRLSGRPAGIVGLGRIGRAIARRLAAFDMPIHYWTRRPAKTPEGWTAHPDARALAEACDVLFVALPGGAATEKLVGAEVIDALGAEGMLVNISRGTTVDEAALLEALENGRIRGAALDVFLNEPKIDPRFLALPNVLLQPHQGSATQATRGAMAALQRANLRAFFEGAPPPTPVDGRR